LTLYFFSQIVYTTKEITNEWGHELMNKMPNNLRNIRKSQTDKQLRSGSHIAELMDITVQYYYDLETGRGGRKLNIQHHMQDCGKLSYKYTL